MLIEIESNCNYLWYSFCYLLIAPKTQLNQTAFMTDNANGGLWLEMAQRKIMAGSAKCAKRLARRLTAAASGAKGELNSEFSLTKHEVAKN